MNKIQSSIINHFLPSAIAAFAAMAAHAITWEGTTNLVMSAATTVDVPAGRTNVIEELSGAYTLTKTGAGALEIRYVKTVSASVVVSEGLVRFANPRPDEIFAKAYFHVDASDLSTMTIETVNGTNFVTRWNDVDGRTDRYATHCTTVWNCRTNPDNRKPFLRENFQNGLPVMDFGTLLTQYNMNELGQALGYGAAMKFDHETPYIKEGFTVFSDTEDYYDWKCKGYGMSLFSHETSWRFARCVLSPTESSTYRGLLNDNSQNNNYFAQGKSIWFDGALVTDNPKWTKPSPGFHICRIHPTANGNTTFNSFAAEYCYGSTRSYGGQRIAEYILFTNATEMGESSMTTNEATVVNRYLRVKWFPQQISRVTVEEGASLDVNPSANLTIQTLNDNGALNLALTSQTSIVDRGLSSLRAHLHLDASQTNTMTIVSDGGTNFITRWNDVDGGSLYVIHETGTGGFGQRPNPDQRKPFLSPNLTQNGLPIIDLGTAIFSNYTNSEGVAYGYGAAFRYNNLPSTKIREYIAVISDREDLKQSPANRDGPSYIAYYTGNTYNGQNEGRRGLTIKNKNPALFYNVSSSTLAPFSNGTLLVDGVEREYTYNPPDGFSVMNFQMASAVNCNLIGRTLRKDVKTIHDTYGGQRIAEYIVFTSLLDNAKRQRIYNALRNKWFGDVPATTNYYNSLSLGAEASMTVKYEAVAVTNALSLAGTLASPAVSAVNVAVAGSDATVDGALTLADGATLSFKRLSGDTWTSLSVTSLVTEGAVTVSLAGSSLKGMDGKSVRLIATETPPASLISWSMDFTSAGTRPKLVLKDDGVWVEFVSPNLVILVK